MLANLIRGCLGEFGIVAPLGIRRVAELIDIIRDDADDRIPREARIAMTAVADQLCDLQRRIKEIERALVVGKAVLIADALPFLRRYDRASLIKPILFKTLIYSVVVFFVRFSRNLSSFGSSRTIP